MLYLLNMLLIMLSNFSITGCSTVHRVNGWYSVADIPENKIVGKAIVTTKDFASVSFDKILFSDMTIIEGIFIEEKIKKWAEATESRIGKRIGFVFNDYVVIY